jgi:hypothetical protein
MMYGEEALEPSVTRKKTYDLLMNKALFLFEQGEIPSISRLATEAGVSRATAYRYFPLKAILLPLPLVRVWKLFGNGNPKAMIKSVNVSPSCLISRSRKCFAMKVPCALRCLFHCSNGRLSVTPRIKWKKAGPW